MKIVAYGKATPATRSSISSLTSRNGPLPKVISGGMFEKNRFGTLKYFGTVELYQIDMMHEHRRVHIPKTLLDHYPKHITLQIL